MPTLHNTLSDEIIAINDGFWRELDIDFRYETKARKVCSIQVSLHREPRLSNKVNWKFVTHSLILVTENRRCRDGKTLL